MLTAMLGPAAATTAASPSETVSQGNATVKKSQIEIELCCLTSLQRLGGYNATFKCRSTGNVLSVLYGAHTQPSNYLRKVSILLGSFTTH